MTNTFTKTLEKPRLSIKTQTIFTALAIVFAVALPQIFHIVGAASGLGTSLGETLLPMHLPIILVGLLAGPYAGLISGIFAPLLSFSLTGMPSALMLPFMMIELGVYGLSAGLLRNAKMPSIGKVVVSQLAGRAVRAAAIVFAIYLLGNNMLNVAVIWKSVVTGLPGLLLQWSLLPLIAYYVDNRRKNEQ